jgi:hypothetical protein
VPPSSSGTSSNFKNNNINNNNNSSMAQNSLMSPGKKNMFENYSGPNYENYKDRCYFKIIIFIKFISLCEK